MGRVMGLVVDLHGEALLKLFADAFSAMRPLLARGRSDDCEGESVRERERCYGAGGRLARGAPAEAFRGRLLGDEALLARGRSDDCEGERV